MGVSTPNPSEKQLLQWAELGNVTCLTQNECVISEFINHTPVPAPDGVMLPAYGTRHCLWFGSDFAEMGSWRRLCSGIGAGTAAFTLCAAGQRALQSPQTLSQHCNSPETLSFLVWSTFKRCAYQYPTQSSSQGFLFVSTLFAWRKIPHYLTPSRGLQPANASARAHFMRIFPPVLTHFC